MSNLVLKFSLQNIKIIPLIYIAFVLCTTGLPLYLGGYCFMKKIPLTRGKFAFVDDEDYDRLIGFNWTANKAKGVNKKGEPNYRAMKNKSEKCRYIYMHRMIMNVTDPKIWVDHKDRNPLNNRKKNLRLCNAQQSACNVVREKTTNSSKYRGVYLTRKYTKKIKKDGGISLWESKIPMWRAIIHADGKSKHLGWFRNEKKAALAYNQAALKYQGEFAVLNKI